MNIKALVHGILSVFLVLAPTQGTAEDIDLGNYTCAQFLSDVKKPANGEKLLKSMMMISWSTGFAAAFQQSAPRADATAIRLMAATLGIACGKNPERPVVHAVIDELKQFTNVGPQITNTTMASPPVSIPRGSFNAYNNFDMRTGDLRTLKKVGLSACIASCESDIRCQAYSFDKWNEWCFLKSSVTKLVLEPSAITGIRKTIDPPSQSDSTIRIDRRAAKTLEGKVLKKDAAKSPELCEQSCGPDQKCLGFTFSKKTEACQLFGDITTLSLDRESVSGVKTQSPP
jgi:PAN domain